MKAENRASNDTESAQSSSHQFRQVVACNVFDDFAATGSERAIGKGNGDADDEVAKRSKAETKRAAVVRGQDASDRRFFRPKRIKSEALTMLRERFLQRLNGAPGFDSHREVGPSVFENSVEPARREDEIG